MLGSRSVPPAISIAAGPSPARIFAASATVRGARKSNHGSRIIALGLLAVAAFPGRRDINRLRVRDGRELLGARSEEHTSELQSHSDLVCRLLLEKKKKATELAA